MTLDHNSPPFAYRLFGVCFQSDVELQLPQAPSSEPPRLKLRAHQGPWPADTAGRAVFEVVEEWISLRNFADGSVEMAWPDWLSLWIDPKGESVSYLLNETTYPSAFEAFIANFAISACLLMQGEEPLHATVIRHRDTGIGFAGPSGAGKSTLTVNFLNRGAELITDDMLRITQSDGRVMAEPGLARLKLLEDAMTQHAPDLVKVGRWNPFSEKYLFDFDSPTKPRIAQELHCLFFLSYPLDDQPDDIVLERLEGRKLFETLSASTMNSAIQSPGRLERQFKSALDLGRKLPVYALHYPRRHDIFEELIKRIEETAAKHRDAGRTEAEIG